MKKTTRNGALQEFAELQSLFFATRRLIRQRLSDTHADPSGWLRFETLRFVGSGSGTSLQDVAKHLRITSPSASALIDKLARSGLVRRERGSDRRMLRLWLTQKGSRDLREALRASQEALRSVFGTLPAKDRAALRRILERVAREKKR